MREIKFRGRSVSTGQWVYGYYQAGKGEHPLDSDPIPLPTIKPGDKVKSIGVVVRVSEEFAAIEDYVGNRYHALLDGLEVSHES
ncbi:hypothetical protein QYF50_18815 [Paenibacillus vini]|uniref:hypothetical protein n=1 Tax=Paenibacillus vini TaxID=1476024 RepID=UPI0025B6531D|nr:hypothetical protein [Paenibacillus vini]MDN4069958.1 hypothetical protein [Paenibacillus vini]